MLLFTQYLLTKPKVVQIYFKEGDISEKKKLEQKMQYQY